MHCKRNNSKDFSTNVYMYYTEPVTNTIFFLNVITHIAFVRLWQKQVMHITRQLPATISISKSLGFKLQEEFRIMRMCNNTGNMNDARRWTVWSLCANFPMKKIILFLAIFEVFEEFDKLHYKTFKTILNSVVIANKSNILIKL